MVCRSETLQPDPGIPAPNKKLSNRSPPYWQFSALILLFAAPAFGFGMFYTSETMSVSEAIAAGLIFGSAMAIALILGTALFWKLAERPSRKTTPRSCAKQLFQTLLAVLPCLVLLQVFPPFGERAPLWLHPYDGEVTMHGGMRLGPQL
jgi:hypothetical protein